MMVVIKENLLNHHTEWLLDGYPRTLSQARQFDAILAPLKTPITAALFLDVSDDVIIERIANRWIHLSSGRVYHKSYNPPKRAGLDDVTGEPLIQREDDKEEKVKFRLEKFHENTKPLLDYYRKNGILHIIPSPNSDVGYEHIKKVWAELFGQ